MKNLTKKDLEAYTVKSLREVAKKLNVVGRWEMKREELIAAILEAEKSTKDSESAVEENSVGSQSKEAKVKAEKELAIAEDKANYIETAPLGTLVAFRLDNGRVKSAKIKKKSTSKRRFLLETGYGAEYIVPFENIIWVRTGNRWPKGVYNLLKGNEVANG